MNRPSNAVNGTSTLGGLLLFLLFIMVLGYWLATLYVPPFGPGFGTAQTVSVLLLVAFWSILVLLVFGVLLAGAVGSFFRILKRSLWAKALFPAYLAVHLVIYGIVLERITTILEGAPPLSFGPQAFMVFNFYFFPHTLFNTLLQMTQNPGIVIILPPFYGVTLGPFAIFSAVLIGLLVTVHIDRILHLSGRIRKAGGSVVYPAVGIVGGASCCISLPDIAASASPFALAIFSTPLWVNLLYILYYLLPISVIVAFAVTLLPSGAFRKGK